MEDHEASPVNSAYKFKEEANMTFEESLYNAYAPGIKRGDIRSLSAFFDEFYMDSVYKLSKKIDADMDTMKAMTIAMEELEMNANIYGEVLDKIFDEADIGTCEGFGKKKLINAVREKTQILGLILSAIKMKEKAKEEQNGMRV